MAAAVDAAVTEAARASGLPRVWIQAVMQAESGVDPRAVSPKGAMGLMQLMPQTWAQLRAELGLGNDPFDVHDNVVAGAVYLRRMHDRFGWPGMFAAYNAGPARYAQHLQSGRPLPVETQTYVSRLAGDHRIAVSVRAPVPHARADAAWRTSPLFPQRADAATGGGAAEGRVPAPEDDLP